MTRIGIFLCTCDGKIDKGIQVDAIRYGVRANQDVAGVTITPHLCLPEGLQCFQDEIRKRKLDRVVLAACPERYLGKKMRETCSRVGINRNHVAVVDWREGCAWAHRGDRPGATAQAIDLIEMAVARVAAADAIESVSRQIVQRVLIIGGGIAGMTASRGIADRGIAVTLVEREAWLGGALREEREDTSRAEDTTRLEVLRELGVDVRLESSVVEFEGSPGEYRVKVKGATSQADEFEVGAVVVATGAQEYRDPRLYPYDGRSVLTLGEFERQIPTEIPSTASSIVYLLCAGARDEHIPYCSNVCCLGALAQAIRLKRRNSTCRVTILFRDLYLLGDDANDEIVHEARGVGIDFLRYAASAPPRVDDKLITVTERGSGRTHCLGFDRLVLATPLVPREDAGVLARLLKVTRDENGFFIEPHMRLKPEQQAEPGIFICGSAHGPVDNDTAVLEALGAAARAARFVSRRQIERPAASASVQPQLCTGCAQCVETCEFHAIKMTTSTAATDPSNGKGPGSETARRATIDPFLCVACGNCVVACPSKAIIFPAAPDMQILAQIDAALAGRLAEERRLVVFGCQWSGFAAMEQAGSSRKQYSPEVRMIELPCSARLDPIHVLYAFLNGADRVLVALCPPHECHFGNGNRYAEARLENLRSQLAAHGIDSNRLAVERMMGDDANAWVKAVGQVA